MKEYHIFETITEDYIDILKLHLISLKHWKNKESKYIIHLYIDGYNYQFFQKELNKLNDNTFIIEIASCSPYKNLIDTKHDNLPYMVSVKLLLPKLFPDLDNILALDSDTLIMNSGLEQFMDSDIDNYYVNAVLDLPVNNCPKEWKLGYSERKQCKTKNYFNCGVCQFNLKKIRKDKMDKEMIQSAIEWPKKLQSYFNEQTICNYLLRKKVKVNDPKFNNMSLVVQNNCALEDIGNYIKKWKYETIKDLLDKTVILHFAGPKPWNELKDKNKYPLFQLAVEQYESIKKELE